MGLPRVRPHPPLQVQHDPEQVQRDWSGSGTEEPILIFLLQPCKTLTER